MKQQTTNSKSLQKRNGQPNWEISKTQAQLHLSAYRTDSFPLHQAFALKNHKGHGQIRIRYHLVI